MKLLVLVSLIALSSAAYMQSQGFLQILADHNTCGKGIKTQNMCNCQKAGCSFESVKKFCTDVGTYVTSTTFTAGILGQCNQATTLESCSSAIAWRNRYGGKTDCAWCSGICVRTDVGDKTCTRTGRLDTFLGSKPKPQPKPEPKPEEKETKKDERKKEIDKRVKDNGGLEDSKTLFGITLVWENCNDLDLWLENPKKERIFWEEKKDKQGGFLDIDMNADECQSYKPVENIRYEKGTKPLDGTYTITVNYYGKQDTMSLTPYTLQLKMAGKVFHAEGEATTVYEKNKYYFTLKDGKGCIGKTMNC